MQMKKLMLQATTLRKHLYTAVDHRWQAGIVGYQGYPTHHRMGCLNTCIPVSDMLILTQSIINIYFHKSYSKIGSQKQRIIADHQTKKYAIYIYLCKNVMLTSNLVF